jgi:hypothetical protein
MVFLARIFYTNKLVANGFVGILMMKLHDYVNDKIIIGYVWQFLNRCVEWGGLYQDYLKELF